MASKAVPLYSHDKRDEADAPLCGNLHPQPEHSKNTLLSKPHLGCVKPTCFDLPSAGGNLQHEYGLRLHRDGLTSGDVVGDWAQHDGTANLVPRRDFKQLNAEAVAAGKTSSKGFSEYRLTHDARVKSGSSIPVLPVPYDKVHTTFGRSTQSEIPMHDLMSHSYRFDWTQTAPTASDAVAAKKKSKPGQTKTSRLNAEVSHAKVQAMTAKDVLDVAYANGTAGSDGLWKMKNFAAVPPRVGYKGE